MNPDKQFEQQVIELARHIWPSSAVYGGSSIQNGRERDGIFETEEMIHLVEVTTSRTKKKAETDIRKLEQLSREMLKKKPNKGVKGWFITKYEPTAEQRDIARKTHGGVVAISFMQFQSKLINANEYLSARENAPFGSVRDPKTGEARVSITYVPLDVTEKKTGEIWSISNIVQHLSNGGRFVLLGDYGAGKSTTLREIFFEIRKKYYTNQIKVFPIFLNLRDHAGQNDPSEALERHARRIGFSSPSHLVRAWRAGYTILILDGFDELATAGWAGRTQKLQQIRFRSMELVRKFISESPNNSGIIISGREHYFDNKKERVQSLTTSSFLELSLNEFTEEQISGYLAQFGWDKKNIPDWLPSRPLLLGYLASRDLLQPALKDYSLSPAKGWDNLLTRISEREAAIEVGIDAETVRRIIERLATHARSGTDGLGPLSQSTIINTFSEVVGYDPDDRGMILLQRLPGLGVNEPEDGSRRFIDMSLVDAARVGDVLRFVNYPYTSEIDPNDWNICLDTLGVDISVLHLEIIKKVSGILSTAIDVAINKNAWNTLGIDILRILMALDIQYTGGDVIVENVLVNYLYLGEFKSDFSGITFKNCYFRNLELDSDLNENKLPVFRDCFFGEIIGRVGIGDMTKNFDKESCIFESFDQYPSTTKSILNLSLPLRAKVLLTILKKLYLQPGRGRRENALMRGLDHRERALVPELLGILQSDGLAFKVQSGSNTIWLPARENQGRVTKLLSSPNTSDDPLLNI